MTKTDECMGVKTFGENMTKYNNSDHHFIINPLMPSGNKKVTHT